MGAIMAAELDREALPTTLGTGPDAPGSNAGLEAESWLGVPILIGDRVIGVIALEAFEKNAYDESTERLLGTIATSMASALENARLFDETKRLLVDADERAGELTVINEIGEALARQLEFDAIIQLVGERVRELFARAVDVHRDPRAGHEPDLVPVRPRRGRTVPARVRCRLARA